MAVCKYFLEGCCRYGQRCKFKHTYNDPRESYYGSEDHSYRSRNSNYKGFSGVSILRASGSPYTQQSNTASNYTSSNYDTNSGFNNSNYNSNSSSGQRSYPQNQSPQDLLPVIQKDLEVLENGNQWPLTCFCPIKDITGNAPGWVDHSPEELRWEIYKASKDGKFEHCKATIQELYKEAQKRRNDFKTREKAIAIIDRMIQEKQLGITTGTTAPNILQYGGQIEVSTPQPAFMSSQPSTFESPFAITKQAVVAPSFPQSRIFEDPAPTFSFALNQGSVGTVNSNVVTDSSSSQIFTNTNNVSSNQVIFNANPASTNLDSNENTTFSILSELSENELSSFQANTFRFGQVPLKPPPKELCNYDGDSHL